MRFIKKRNFLSFLISSSFLFSPLPGIAMEEDMKEEAFIDKLPPCALRYTLSFLPDRDLGSMALVSKKFSEILAQDIFWRGRIEGITTKKDYLDFIKTPVLSLKLTENESILLSPYDVLNIATSSKIIINDGVYTLKNNEDRINLVSMLRPETNDNFCLNEYNLYFKNKELMVEYVDRNEEYTGLEYPFQKSDLDSKKFRAVEQKPYVKDEEPIFFIKKLEFLDKEIHQKKLVGSCSSYWGRNHSFDILNKELWNFSLLTSPSPSFKSNLLRFFIERYEEFRQKNDSLHGEGYYAYEYLNSVMLQSSCLQINLNLSEYESLLEYIHNSKLSEEDKENIKNSYRN